MNSIATTPDESRALKLSMHVAIHLTLVVLIVAWCFVIMRPFLIIFLWALILAVASKGIYGWLVKMVGGKRGMAGTLYAIGALALVLVPSYFVGDSLVSSVSSLRAGLEAGTLQAPPPPENIQNFPVIGSRVYDAWLLASDDMQQAMTQFEPQIRAFGRWALGFLAGIGGTVLRTAIALIIAAAFLTYADPLISTIRRLGSRIEGQFDEDLVSMTGATIDSVAKGVLGIALIQAALCGIGLFVAGVPAAGLFTVVVLVLATIQVPAILAMILPIIWAFSNLGILWAILFTIYQVLACASDIPLKPMLLGRGVSIPSGVILIGAIGGMMSMGMLGLFVGAVVLGIGYKLIQYWVRGGKTDEVPAEEPATA
jgi:predicted PurR-regulated permease PerM